MAPLRIHFFVQCTHEQGTYFRFHNLAIALRQLGQRVTVYGGDCDPKSRARRETRDGIEYVLTPSSRGLSVVMAPTHPLNALRRWAHSYPPCDVAHLFQPFPSATLAWNKTRAKVKFYDWDDLLYGGFWHDDPSTTLGQRYNQGVTGWLEHVLPSRAACVTTCSRFLADLAQERGAKRAFVVHNGLWPFEPMPKGEARRQLKLQPDALYVGFMGRTYNEIRWCLQAVEANLVKHPRLRLAVCGPPPEVLQSASPSLLERVDYLGQLTPLQTRDFAAAIDLGLLPLEDEPFNRSRFPIKFAEYMAAGSPVLCSDVGECAYLAQELPWVVLAGHNEACWTRDFGGALERFEAGMVPPVQREVVRDLLDWSAIGARLLEEYRRRLAS